MVGIQHRPSNAGGKLHADITPPLGIPLAGYYHARGADGVLDPLSSKALVMEVNGTRAAWVALDLISVTRAVTDQTRAAIQQATGIPGEHVMIAATHTHTAPALAGRGRRDVTLGACGNLNHLDFSWRWPQTTPGNSSRSASA
jgi:neutral ceramidase